MKQNVLIADDDPHIREVIQFALEDAGFNVCTVENGARAVIENERNKPDLMILDVGMPEMDGFQACKKIRKQSDVPILFLTARDEEIDRVLGFELGGDDYVTKPFSPRELALRVRAILARHTNEKTPNKTYAHGELSLDVEQHKCHLNTLSLDLTAREFSLLEVLIKYPQKIYSKAGLIDEVYGPNTHLSDRTIDSHIRNLRQKTKTAGYEDVITTVHGVGVKLGSCKN